MRLSATQKDILFVLFAIENSGNTSPVPSINIFNMINGSRSIEIFDSNFRASCHKLNDNNLIGKYRSQSLKLAWSLSESGRTKASEIFNKRNNQGS